MYLKHLLRSQKTHWYWICIPHGNNMLEPYCIHPFRENLYSPVLQVPMWPVSLSPTGGLLRVQQPSMSSSASAESTNCQSHCFAFTSSAFFSPQLQEFKNPKPTNTDPADTRGQLCFPIVYKGLEHPWILGSLDGRGWGVFLEPIPHECWGVPVFVLLPWS